MPIHDRDPALAAFRAIAFDRPLRGAVQRTGAWTRRHGWIIIRPASPIQMLSEVEMRRAGLLLLAAQLLAAVAVAVRHGRQHGRPRHTSLKDER